MSRCRWFRLFGQGFPLLIVILLVVGCSHHAPSASAPPAAVPGTPVAGQAAPPAGQDFQPYTLIPQPAPKPAVVTPRHRVLHLAVRADHPYLVDSDGHAYQVGRDAQGHLYPVYRDKVTGAAYPLYYDNARDRLYRVARADNGHFYHGYVGDPDDRFYASDHYYDWSAPSASDRPVIEDSYNTTYNTYNDGDWRNAPPAYRVGYPYPTPHNSGHHTKWNWLWAIPVIVGAYLLLQPHHHSAPHYQYVHSPGQRPTTVIVRNINNNYNAINNVNRVAVVNRVPPAAYPQSSSLSPSARPPVHPLVMARRAGPVAFVAPRTMMVVHPHAFPFRPFRRKPLQREIVRPALVVHHAPIAHHALVVHYAPVIVRRPAFVSSPTHVFHAVARAARLRPVVVRHSEPRRAPVARPLLHTAWHPAAPRPQLTFHAPPIPIPHVIAPVASPVRPQEAPRRAEARPAVPFLHSAPRFAAPPHPSAPKPLPRLAVHFRSANRPTPEIRQKDNGKRNKPHGQPRRAPPGPSAR